SECSPALLKVQTGTHERGGVGARFLSSLGYALPRFFRVENNPAAQLEALVCERGEAPIGAEFNESITTVRGRHLTALQEPYPGCIPPRAIRCQESRVARRRRLLRPGARECEYEDQCRSRKSMRGSQPSHPPSASQHSVRHLDSPSPDIGQNEHIQGRQKSSYPAKLGCCNGWGA